MLDEHPLESVDEADDLLTVIGQPRIEPRKACSAPIGGFVTQVRGTEPQARRKPAPSRSASRGAMLIWVNGPFGGGKTQTAHELQRRLPGSALCDPELVGFGLHST